VARKPTACSVPGEEYAAIERGDLPVDDRNINSPNISRSETAAATLPITHQMYQRNRYRVADRYIRQAARHARTFIQDRT
jgi:hypothetical protein